MFRKWRSYHRAVGRATYSSVNNNYRACGLDPTLGVFMSSKQRTLLSCAISGILGVSATATAQQTRRENVLEEVVVTAEKREASLQEVPVAVSAYTSETRVQLGLNTIEDFARITPSMTYRNDDRLSIRGFGRLTNSIGTDPSVALYSDGIFSTSMADTSTPPLFIERTEILRGPQGTLYGRNSIGGTLNIISKRPTDEFEGEVRVGAGNYAEWKTDVLFRGPFTDSLRYLIGGSIQQRDDGYIENVGTAEDSGTSDRWMVEGQLEADLGENVVARVRYSKFEWNDTYGVGNALENIISPYDATSPTGGGDDALYYNTTLGYAVPNPGVTDVYKLRTNRDAPGILRDHDRIHLDVTWDLGGATLKYLGGYQDYGYDTGGDRDGTDRLGAINVPFPAGIPFPVDVDGPGGAPAFAATAPAFTAAGVSVDGEGFYTEEQRWWSNEINLSSNGDGAVQWIVGLYQYDQTYKQRQGIRIYNDNSLLAPSGGPANPERNILVVDGLLETNSYAGFGQIDWTFAEAWTFTLGARYTQDEKEGWDAARYVSRSINTALGAAGSVVGQQIVGAVRAGQVAGVPADAPLSVIQALVVPGLANMIAPLVVPATQGVALDVTSTVICGGAPCPAYLTANPGGGLRRALNDDWDAVTGTAGIQWEPNADTNVYARYSRGYKSGGWYGNGGLPADIYADPEYVNSYEIGWKNVFGGRFQFNVAVFHNDYEGLQAPLTAIREGGTTSTQFLNLDAITQGVELETVWSPVDNLQLLFNASYLNTEFEDSACCYIDGADPQARAPGAQPVSVLANGSVTQTVSGNNLPLSPETKFSFGANYTWDFTPGSLTLGGLYTRADDQQSTIFANPLYTSPKNDVADFRLIWNGSENRYTVVAFVKNAFDEEGYLRSTNRQSAAGPRRNVAPIFPRTYGAEVQFRF